MTTTPAPDPFAALDAQHAGEDRFTRNPQNRPELGGARTHETVTGATATCPGCVGRGTGSVCGVCGGDIPADLRRTVDSPSEVRPSAANFSIEVGPVSVDEIGPASSRQYEIGLWDNDEGAFLHGMILPDQEAAEALHRALGRLLFG